MTRSIEINNGQDYYDAYEQSARGFNSKPAADRISPRHSESLGNVRRMEVVASGFPAGFVPASGAVKLHGKEIHGAQDLAELAQVYRHPGYETMRYFFTKGGVIVGQNAVTSRLPGASSVLLGNTDAEKAQWAIKISDEAKQIGADGIWFLHNHPDGDPLGDRKLVCLQNYIK